MIERVVDAEHAGARLDQLVHESIPGLSRSAAQRLVDDGNVTVDGEAKSRSTRVQRGQVVVIDQPEVEEIVQEVPEVLEPTILYEDEHLVVVDKPIGLVTHDSPGSPGPSLASLLQARGLALFGRPEFTAVDRDRCRGQRQFAVARRNQVELLRGLRDVLLIKPGGHRALLSSA